jgi:hypothetical protein
MNLYIILFERLFAFFHKGASSNPSHEKQDGAVLTSTIISCLVFINLLTVMHIIRITFSKEMDIGVLNAIALILILIASNLIYFLKQKRYLIASSFVASFPVRKRRAYSIMALIYSIGSIVLFFLMLKIGK